MKYRNLVVVSDLHCGCMQGLVPDADIVLDGGGVYRPSAIQRQIRKWWHEFWEWVETEDVTHGEDYALLVNGDAIDGVHHGAKSQITQNLSDQARIAASVLQPIIARPRCRVYYHIRGTEAHAGKSGEEEERLAHLLGAKPNGAGQYARYDLWIRVGDSKKGLVHITHAVGVTSSAAYASTGPMRELIEEYLSAAQTGEQPPDKVVRSHRHEYIGVPWGDAEVIVTPGWQAQTPFTWRTQRGRTSMPEFGGVVIRLNDEGVFYHRKFRRRLPRGRVE